MSKVPAPSRREVARREGMTPGSTTVIQCHYCPEKSAATWPLNRNGSASYWPMFGRDFGLDHVIPQARGGSHDADNLVISCGKCNSAKRDMAPERFRSRSGVNRARFRQEGKGRGRDGNGREGIATATNPVVSLVEVAIPVPVVTLGRAIGNQT